MSPSHKTTRYKPICAPLGQIETILPPPLQWLLCAHNRNGALALVSTSTASQRRTRRSDAGVNFGATRQLHGRGLSLADGHVANSEQRAVAARLAATLVVRVVARLAVQHEVPVIQLHHHPLLRQLPGRGNMHAGAHRGKAASAATHSANAVKRVCADVGKRIHAEDCRNCVRHVLSPVWSFHVGQT